MSQFRLIALSSLALLQATNGFVTDPQTLIVRGEVALHDAKSSVVDVNVESNERLGRRGFLATAAMSLGAASSLPALPAFADGDDPTTTTTLHILNYPIDGKCGEAKVPENGVFFAKTFGKLEDGSCAAEGYSIEEGTANGTGEKDSKREYSIYGK